ncbi:thiamine pyrophosphate-binding protein [Arthrobacter cryoconiti]|uniref:Thiamine pyrophosphate-binding protein n=1 Tax=Arthrobacter cryoconiti TaxID=748907 RepID=A0ABV8R1L8_9MICC|nr:thiamine pyrophosphate-binding protein [Arthrobacter cryoconiti]MCC9068137.1 thiamine pyrophosphate-dependent enzyme [Arthrobacter cryoconiti]
MTTVSARIADVLSFHTSHIFGVMGNGNAYFLDAAASTSLTFTPVRHEAAAVSAADAHYRVCSRLAVATTTYGAGFSNAITALAESVQARTPLVLVTGDAPTSGKRPWDIDQAGIASSVGAPTFVVGADNAGHITRLALTHALTERTAVVLAIPYDLATAEITEGDLTPEHPLNIPVAALPHAATLDRAAALLTGAQRPLVLAGRGAALSGAGAALRDLADRIGALNAGSVLGCELMPGRHGDLGVAGGFSSEESAALMAEADVVLVAGASLNQFTMRFGDLFNAAATIIQVDLSPTPTNPRVDIHLCADARATGEALLARVPQAPANTGWRDRLGDRLTAVFDREQGSEFAPDGRLDPRALSGALDAVLPQDRVIVQDGGHFIGWAPMFWKTSGPQRMNLVGTAYQSIGLGLASAVGAGVAAPAATVVLATGDGGFLMALADLESMIRTVRSGIIIVFNDAAYGAEVHQYGTLGLAQEPMLIPEVNFAAMAAAMGAASSVVQSHQDLDALRHWVKDGAHGVFLADCRISRSVVAPYMAEIQAAAKKGRAVKSASGN